MLYSSDEFKTTVMQMKKQANRIRDEIAKYDNIHIICRNKGAYKCYAECINGKEKAISKDKRRIYELTKVEYLRQQLAILENNISVMEKCSKKYIDPTPEEVERRFIKKHPKIPLNEILVSENEVRFGGSSADNLNIPASQPGDSAGNPGDAWAKAPYDKNPSFPENLRFRTPGGLFVRSKSEAIIAGYLESANIPFHYDARVDCKTTYYYADFIIKRPNNTLLIWEHFGRENDASYMRKNWVRVLDYIDIGYRPWNDLVWTFDSDLADYRTIKTIVDRFVLHS